MIDDVARRALEKYGLELRKTQALIGALMTKVEALEGKNDPSNEVVEDPQIPQQKFRY